MSTYNKFSIHGNDCQLAKSVFRRICVNAWISVYSLHVGVFMEGKKYHKNWHLVRLHLSLIKNLTQRNPWLYLEVVSIAMETWKDERIIWISDKKSMTYIGRGIRRGLMIWPSSSDLRLLDLAALGVNSLPGSAEHSNIFLPSSFRKLLSHSAPLSSSSIL